MKFELVIFLSEHYDKRNKVLNEGKAILLKIYLAQIGKIKKMDKNKFYTC